MIREVLTKIVSGENLSQLESSEVMKENSWFSIDFWLWSQSLKKSLKNF